MNFWSYKFSVFCLMIGRIKVYKWFYIVIFIKVYQSMSSFPWKLSSTSIISKYSTKCFFCLTILAVNEQVRIQRGGQGVRTPPGKSQDIWVSIGNKQLDPHPHPPGKCWTPSGTLKNDKFLWNWPFDCCKISWGLKKKKKNVRAFFVRLTWTPPDKNS